MIAFVRIDSRLIHGQVVEAWLPGLHVSRVLVADDAAAASALTRAAIGLAVPASAKVEVVAVAAADFAAAVASPERFLVLVRDVAAATRARERGLTFSSLNLGNVHYQPGRAQISPSVFLSGEEVEALRAFARAGVTVDLRAVPKDKPLALPEIEARLAAASHAPGA
ncbi:MAG: PTS sugar transporter subunit IIB [Deltaproteobacteria bacterium]|nr:PTS sugar transporter subunit IIB [Deltaproteobacteria bacterium]